MSDNASGSQIEDIGTIKVEPDSNVNSTTESTEDNTTATATSTPEASNTEKELRENLIQNAVQFLSHENVRSTPLVKKIAFLESKGLTSDEIQEAMSRVTNANRTKVAPQSTKPILTARQPTNRPSYLSNTAAVQTPTVAAPVVYTQPIPPPPPPPAQGTSLWKVIIGTMIMTLGTVGGISLLFKHLTKNLPSTTKQGQPLLDSNTPLSHNELVNNNIQNSNNNNINNGNNFNQSNRNPIRDSNNNNVIGNNNSGSNGNIAAQQYSAKSISSNNVNNNSNNNNSSSNNNKEKQKDGIEKVDINELKNAITELQNTLRDIRLSETTRSPSLNTPSGYPVSTNQTPGNNTQPRLNQNYSQTPLRSSSPASSTATPNKPQLPLQQQQQHVYAPFTHQRATVSDIYQQMKNGEDIPGINKNIDDSPSNTALPSPVSASSSKPWERRRNQKKDQYSTTPLRNSEPNVNSPSYLTNSQNLLSSSAQLKIVEVDEEPQDQGVENNVQLFESLENITTEEKKLE